eukprot:symbB.v1.2.020908.t2/scaffold1784.1/size101483/4
MPRGTSAAPKCNNGWSWCEVEQPLCQGADWGVCDSEEDPILAGSFPICIRVVPSNATRIFEYEPCQHRFTYVRQPHVDSLSPRSGPSSGGTNVSLHGRYFPQARLGGLLCRFGEGKSSSVAPARWLSRQEITCVSPEVIGHFNATRTVPVTISINGGSDWTPTTAYFSFVKELRGTVYPSFGPRGGGTLLDVHVPRDSHTTFNEFSQVVSCCFGEPPATMMPASRISDMLYQCKTPPWPQSPAQVSIGVAQADGRCQSPPYSKFDYVEPWKIHRIYPSEFDEKQQAEGFRLFISGENFLPAKTAICRLGGKILAPAEVIGTNYTLLCMVPPTGFQLAGSPGGITYEVEVAINGQDFIRGTPPVLVRFVSATAVVTVEPENVSALGHLPLTVAGSGLSADVRYCIFGEDERAIEVPVASLASEREVVCTTPHWEIRPYGAVSERVMVRLSSDGVGAARSPSAYVNFVAYPYVHTVDPNEGPVEGGTIVRAYGHHFQPNGEDILLQCVFGSRKSKALVISDTELQCTSPPVDGAFSPTGHLASFDLETIPATPMVKGTTHASNQQPMKQLTFYYRRFVPSISLVEPLSGPEFGNTLVSLRSDVPILNSRNIKCLFGNIAVPLFMVTQNEATCTSPAFNEPSLVELTLSADGQNRVQIGPNGEAVRFKYYITPTVAKVTPAFGSSRGGTIVQLEGAHFINDGRLTCKFGDLTVPAFRFISSALERMRFSCFFDIISLFPPDSAAGESSSSSQIRSVGSSLRMSSMIAIDVVLASGRTATVTLDSVAFISDLKIRAEEELGMPLLNVSAEGKILKTSCTLADAGLKDGATVTASARRASLVGGSAAFAVIRGDASVITWGEGRDGGNSSRVQHLLKDVQTIIGNSSSFAALLGDKSVVVWGNAADGGDSSKVQSQLNDVTSIISANSAFAAILSDGHVVTWGQAENGGDSSSVQALLEDVKDICGANHSFAAIRRNGTVVTWGRQTDGGSSEHIREELQDVISISSTACAFAAIRKDSTVITWGDPTGGGDSTGVKEQLKHVVKVTGTDKAFAAILTDGHVVTWGDPKCGGNSSSVQSELINVREIVGNCNAFAAILESGKVVTWNCDYDKDELYDIQHIEHSLYDFIALRKDGTVVTWGNGRYKVPELKEVCQIAASSSAFAALQVDGKVVTWGLGPLGGDSSSVAEQLQNVKEVNATASQKILPGVSKRKASELRLRKLLCNEVSLSNNGQNFTGGSDAKFQFLGFTYFHLHPYLGPISGNTTVLVESATVPVGASSSIRCRFGTLTVQGVYVNDTFLQCVSPAVVTQGEVKFEVALNQQDFVEASQKFLYYEIPRITAVDPPLGPNHKGLSIRLLGQGFISTNYLKIRFGGVSIEPEGLHLVQTALAPTDTEVVVELPKITLNEDMSRVPVPQCVTAEIAKNHAIILLPESSSHL